MPETAKTQAADAAPEFTLAFGGQPRELSASTFLPCLLSVATIVEELNREYGGDQRVELHVRTPLPGSFLIDLVLSPSASVGAMTVAFFSADMLKLASTIISTFSNLLNIRKHLKKDPPSDTSEAEGGIVIHNSGGSTMIVDRRVFNIYATNTTVGSQLDRAFQALDADPEVTRFEVLGSTKTPLFTAERTDFSDLASGAQLVKDGERRVTERVHLSIVKVSFDHKLRWEFVFNGNRIGALIADLAFWQGVDGQAEAFTKGDVLDVDLQIDQLFDQGLKAYVNRSYKVVRVYAHLKPGRQPGLPL